MGLGKLGKIAVTKAVRFRNGTCQKDLIKSMKTNPFHKATKPLKEIKITKLTENEIIKLTDNEKTTKSLKKIIPSKLSKNEIIKQDEIVINRLKKNLQSNFSESLKVNFETKKARLIEQYLKIGERGCANQISKAQTPEQITKILVQHDIGIFEKNNKLLLSNILTEKGKMKPLTLELEQMIYKNKMQRGKLILAREKVLHTNSTKPEVIAIENILKTKYGCNFVSLKDNEVIAKQVLKAFDIAKKNKAELPKNVITTNNMFADANGENLFNGTILLNLRPNSMDSILSTKADCHTALHEILHSSHPNLVSFSTMKIPENFMDVKRNLSVYSSVSPTHETFTELNTKRMIEGLSKDEYELFCHLNFFA